MSDRDTKQIDAHSGVETTGHEWDGIRELNSPLPRWWVYTFYGTVIWGLAYTVFFPAWPMMTAATQGVLGYSSRQEVAAAMQAARADQARFTDRIAQMDVARIETDPELRSFALAGGAAAFRTNCSQCHGSGAAGAPGYPNLLDDDWIWGGTLADIYQTIRHGVRQTDADGQPTNDTRQNDMPAFGRDGILPKEEIAQLVEYVRQLSGQEHDAAASAQGQALFADNCSGCHGEDGRGMTELGAPNLTDGIWLYGGDRTEIRRTIETARGGMMPAWENRLGEGVVKQLALYVHGLGGGK